MDQIDLNRLIRARTAKRYESIEARRKLLLASKIKPDQLSQDEWAVIQEMDGVLAESTEE